MSRQIAKKPRPGIIIVWSQLTTALTVRPEKESLFKLGLFSNKAMLGAVILGVLLQLAVIYVPSLNLIFDTKPLTAGELLLCTVLAFVPFAAIELEKLRNVEEGEAPVRFNPRRIRRQS